MAMIYWLVSTGRVVAPPDAADVVSAPGPHLRARAAALAAPILLTVGLLAGVATPDRARRADGGLRRGAGLPAARADDRRPDRRDAGTLVTCGVLCFIIACAVPFGWIVATSQAPMKLAALMMSISDNKFVILMIINVALLVIGCFMETTAILLIATPTLFPLIVALGIDPVHFGIILVVNLLIGTLTPPFGVILFIMMDIAKISLARMTRAVLPFYLPLFLTLMVITYWADFVLAVPRFFGKAN
jgi:TRAP-type C4-dicarboxylate transport system permease large subunit